MVKQLSDEKLDLEGGAKKIVAAVHRQDPLAIVREAFNDFI